MADKNLYSSIDLSFHPLLFSFQGFKDEDKNNFLNNLILELKEFKIGHIRFDKISLNNELKTNAEIMMIKDQNEATLLSRRNFFEQGKNIFLDSEIIFIEGDNYSNLTKIVYVDEKLSLLEEIKSKKIEPVVALVGDFKIFEHCSSFNIPCFDVENVLDFADFIREKIREKISAVPIYGMVLCGGTSSRMKRDKSEINYHGSPQAENAYNLLKNYCSEVFISCRKDQMELPHLKKFPQIHDQYLNNGPLGGVLSGMRQYPKAAWIVLACDLPMIDNEVMKKLLDNRGHSQMATAFYDDEKNRFEPLAALYEPKSYHRLFYYLAEGKTSLEEVLSNSNTKIIHFNKDDSLTKSLINADLPQDFEEIKVELREAMRRNTNR